jgi:hypothetical protein
MIRPAHLVPLVVAWVCVAACTTSGSTAGDGGADQSCHQAAYGSCTLGAIQVQHFDAARGCIEAPATVQGLCGNTVDVDPHTCAAASIGVRCAVSPAGELYFAVMRGDQYFSGAGWRTDEYPVYGPAAPNGILVTSEEGSKCFVAACAPACPGAQPLEYANCVADAGGAADGGAADGSRADASATD